MAMSTCSSPLSSRPSSLSLSLRHGVNAASAAAESDPSSTVMPPTAIAGEETGFAAAVDVDVETEAAAAAGGFSRETRDVGEAESAGFSLIEPALVCVCSSARRGE